MNIALHFNTIISKVNSIVCNIKNLQTYIGTDTEESLDTLTGRIAALERASTNPILNSDGKIPCQYIECGCCVGSGTDDSWSDSEEWSGTTEWGEADSPEQITSSEWR